MKFDVVRAWKDETYRQNLSEKQREMVPANPAGELELTDDELEAVFGGGHGHSAIVAKAFAGDEQTRSYALVCEINIFSIDIQLLTLDLVRIGAPRTKVCVQRD
jgi:mersacidin/lichenicidin family type 2 lantibiotic